MGVRCLTLWRCFSVQNLLWAQVKQSFKSAFGFHVILRKALLTLRKRKTKQKQSPTFSSYILSYCKHFYVKNELHNGININGQPNKL